MKDDWRLMFCLKGFSMCPEYTVYNVISPLARVDKTRAEGRVALTNNPLNVLPIPTTLSSADLKVLDPKGECFHQCNQQ